MNLPYSLQSGLHQNIYVIYNFSLNKISRIFVFFSETSNTICNSFFLPRKVKCCYLSLNTTYSAIMKSCFEGRQASFFSISCKVKRAGKCQKEAETRVENSCSRWCSSHGNQPSILEVSVKLERNEKTNEKMLRCFGIS